MLEVSSERVGEDYRNGKNVDNAMLMETFGINGITYGNWVSGPERQAKLNATYDAFLDLAHLLGIPPRAISLNGSLGFQFGASGVGRYSAHYRPADVSHQPDPQEGGWFPGARVVACAGSLFYACSRGDEYGASQQSYPKPDCAEFCPENRGWGLPI